MSDAMDRISAAVRGHETRLIDGEPPPEMYLESQPLRWMVLLADLAAATTTTIDGLAITVPSTPASANANPAAWQASANGGSGGYVADTSLAYSVAETTGRRSYQSGDWLLCRAMGTANGFIWEPIEMDDDRFAVAVADWEVNTVAGTDYPRVSVQRCDDMYGTNPTGDPFWVYFYHRGGQYCPAIFAASGIFDADVVTYKYDRLQNRFYCTSPDAYDDSLGTIKFLYDVPANTFLHQGWILCDGSTPADTKLLDALGAQVAVPDTRGLFTRALESVDTLWTGGATTGAAINNPGHAAGAGGRIGVSANRITLAAGSDHLAVINLEDAQSWAGATADGEALDADNLQHDAVVCPPCYILTQIIRYK